jgi:8-hydroxy-5-deazaflavin:NADPH oxidoreductase
MKIGIIGSGSVAQTLGAGFLTHGHEVVLGTRDPAKLKDWLTNNPKAKAGSNAEAATFGEAIVLAVQGSAAKDALTLAGAANLAGKTIMDATNPIGGAPDAHGILPYFTKLDRSLMEDLQAQFPKSHFVKCFNSVGAPAMVNPQFKAGGRASMFICGNDEAAKKQVTGILDQLGWDAEDMGPAEAARVIEPLCVLWCIPGFKNNDWFHAFKMVR